MGTHMKTPRSPGWLQVWMIPVIILLLLLLIPLWMYMGPTYEGDYRGRVVDAETGEPIEGVVVAGIWYKEIVDLAGGHRVYKDAKETLTDENGEFTIAGKIIKPRNLEMNMMIYKSGYTHINEQSLGSLQNNPKVKVKGNFYIFKIKKIFETKGNTDSDIIITPLRPLMNNDLPMLQSELNKIYP